MRVGVQEVALLQQQAKDRADRDAAAVERLRAEMAAGEAAAAEAAKAASPSKSANAQVRIHGSWGCHCA